MTIGQSWLSEFDIEFANTRKVLERVPEAQFEWKIHAKSNTIGWVANHLVDITRWGEKMLSNDAFDFAPVDGERWSQPNLTRVSELLEMFDATVALVRSQLQRISDASMMQEWALQQAGATLMQMPRVAFLRFWLFNHTIHHRAILTVYLRMHDVPVPAIYGPSADENPLG